MRKIRQESSGDVMCYWMEQGLSDETGFINCYLTCWKFTCQLHFDNTCTSSDLFPGSVNNILSLYLIYVLKIDIFDPNSAL